MSGEFLLTLLGLLLLAAVYAFHRTLRRALQHRNDVKPLARYPSVSVIRPIKGLDFGADENLRAALDTGYPGEVETLFVFDDHTEPAVPLAQRAIGQMRTQGHDVDARVVFSGEPPAGMTGKLNAMVAGLSEAKGELIAFVDSDTRPDRLALRRAVETLLGSPGAGSAFAPVAVTHPPRTAGDAGYALLLNAMYGPDAAAAARRNGGELPFIMGQFMVFTREAIDAIGGLESAQGQLVDDMYLGMRVKAAGLSNRVSPHHVPILQEGLSLRGFWGVFVRWVTFSRTGLPSLAFKLVPILRGLLYYTGLALAIASLAAGSWMAGLLAALVPVGIAASNNSLHRHISGARLPVRHLWVSFALLLVAPFVYLNIFLRHEVVWRGRSYRLDARSFLASGAAIPPDRQCVGNC
jgi:ceramide glucosyltransferase